MLSEGVDMSTSAKNLRLYNLFSIYRTVMVVQLQATDLDFKGNSALHYEIADGNHEHSFQIDSKTGLITVNTTANIATTYKLKVGRFNIEAKVISSQLV